MSISGLRASADFGQLGQDMHEFVSELYPICRSITGAGIRETLHRIQRKVPLRIHEVASGTPVFDWIVPNEWTIREAYVKNEQGERIIDFRRHNLHVWSYSTAVDRTMTLDELKSHLASIPEHPDWIPYRTSYYKENWGFCLSHKQLLALKPGNYTVCIDTTLQPGSLSYGEYVIPGRTDETVFLSTHCCHPSLCNDNLSGIATATYLAKLLSDAQPRYTYKFVFIPGTIGAITWLAQNEHTVRHIKHGFVVAGGGDGGSFHYKQSRRGNAEVDQIVEQVLRDSGHPHKVVPFSPYGYDERQYCSPGFNLPVGALSRTPHGQFAEYHTSADNLDFVTAEHMAQTLAVYVSVISALEANHRYQNVNPKCEVQLGKRGLYRQTGGHTDQPLRESAILWLLNMSDSEHTMLDIVKQSGLPYDVLISAANELLAQNLIQVT